jgi:hypothetical protein
VLYEMLTRHKPFSGENLTVVSHRIVYDHFTPPKEFVKDLAPGLEPILNRALEKDPARRYQRARDMVDDLRRLVEANHQRSDLNETQSLASTMVLPSLPPLPTPQAAQPGAAAAARPAAAAKPSLFSRWRKDPGPPPPLQVRQPVPTPPPSAAVAPVPPPAPSALDATVANDASGSSSGTLLPPVPPPIPPPAADLEDTNATAEVPVLKAPPTRVPARRSSTPQILLVAGLVVVFGVLAAGGFLLWRRGAAGQPDRSAAAAAPSATPAPAPIPVPAPALTPMATPAASPAPAAAPNLDAQLDFARRSATSKRWDAAIAGAQAALMIDPANQEAKQILARAQAAQTRARLKLAQTPREPLPNETAAAATPVIPVTAVTRSSGDASPQAAATTATLRVHFVCEFSDGGVLIVYVNDREMSRVPVEGTRGGLGGIFRSRKTTSRDFNRSIEVPSGTSEIRVSVTPSGRAAIVRAMKGNFQGGASRALEIQLSADGQLADPSLH